MRHVGAKWLLVVAILGLLVLSAGCGAEGVPEPSPNNPSSSALVENSKEFDGSHVTFIGEVIGEAMVRGDMAWLHVNDDAYYRRNVEEGAHLGGYNSGMAVWAPATEADALSFFGDYKHEGDIVEVVGTFNAACGEHGGDTDIHATRVEVLNVGHVVVDEVRPAKVFWALGLSVLTLALHLFDRYWRRTAETRPG